MTKKGKQSPGSRANAIGDIAERLAVGPVANEVSRFLTTAAQQGLPVAIAGVSAASLTPVLGYAALFGGALWLSWRKEGKNEQQLRELFGEVHAALADLHRDVDHSRVMLTDIYERNSFVWARISGADWAAHRRHMLDDIGRILDDRGIGRDTLPDVAKLLDRLTSDVAAIPRACALGARLEQPWVATRPLPFHFSKQDIPIHGRFAGDELDSRIHDFLTAKSEALWWLWTGLEGAGKSRLAMEGCKIAGRAGWDAGFLTLAALRELQGQWHELRLERNTLVVCDYVALDTDAVSAALSAFTYHRDRAGLGMGGHKLRLILLERHSRAIVPTSGADLPPQWCIELFQNNLRDALFLNDQYPRPGAHSLHLDDFTESDARAFALACVRHHRSEFRRRADREHHHHIEQNTLVDRVLNILKRSGHARQWRPLHIRLTSFVLVMHGGSDTTFEQVITTYLRSRIELRKQELLPTSVSVADIDRLINLACVATVLREIKLADLPDHTHLPGPDFRVNPARLMTIMGQPPSSRVIQGLEPDLIGEWFVRLWCSPRRVLGGQLPYPVLAEILDDIPHSNLGVADFVQRTYRYPEFRNHGLWKRLRSRLGRYSTPFGQIFDSQDKQHTLLGGTTRAAEQCYAKAIAHAASTRHEAILVDLMAGGSERCRHLLAAHPHLKILAIDRDTTRLKKLEIDSGERLRAEQHDIDGSLDLRSLLRRHFKRSSCDIVIAKKALHEIPRAQQKQLIRDVGACLEPKTGRCIVYTDSPLKLNRKSRERLSTIVATIRRDEVDTAHASTEWAESVIPDDGATEVEVERAAQDRIRNMAMSLSFDPAKKSDAAIFANMWIALKDWANFNTRECALRYFSSRNELEKMFTSASLMPTGPQDGIHRFYMTLQATRFVEDAINRIGYMCADATVTDEELRDAFDANPRFRLFQEIVAHHLWDGTKPTPFGRSNFVNATEGGEFDLDHFVEGISDRLATIDFASMKGPAFEMPVHVFCLTRQG